jgi:histone H1/5
MSESTAVVEAVAPASPANKKGAKAAKKPASGKPRVKKVSTHPPVAEMVVAAVTQLKERGGSSLQAIKKYLAANYKVEPEKLAQFIKKFIKAAVINGTFVQVKGKGASGSFKLAKTAGDKKKSVKKATTAKPKATKAKKPAAKKATSAAPKAAAKKPATKKKVVAAVAAKSAKKAGSVKSPSKQKPTKASPVKKPKTPKPKKTTAVKKPVAKKAAPKRK